CPWPPGTAPSPDLPSHLRPVTVGIARLPALCAAPSGAGALGADGTGVWPDRPGLDTHPRPPISAGTDCAPLAHQRAATKLHPQCTLNPDDGVFVWLGAQVTGCPGR